MYSWSTLNSLFRRAFVWGFWLSFMHICYVLDKCHCMFIHTTQRASHPGLSFCHWVDNLFLELCWLAVVNACMKITAYFRLSHFSNFWTTNYFRLSFVLHMHGDRCGSPSTCLFKKVISFSFIQWNLVLLDRSLHLFFSDLGFLDFSIFLFEDAVIQFWFFLIHAAQKLDSKISSFFSL